MKTHLSMLTPLVLLVSLCSCVGTMHLDAKQYTLQAIQDNPIVCLGEGGHTLKNSHDFIKEMLSDPDIQRAVDVIIVEFATSRYQEILDDYVFGKDVPYSELSKAWRNTAQTPLVPWDSPLYFELLKHIREINHGLPEGNKIRVLGGEPAIRWEEVAGWADVNEYMGLRDIVPAELAIEQAFQKGNKVLIIYGAAHLTKVHNGPAGGEACYPITYYIQHKYPQTVKVIEFLDTEALGIGERVSELSWGTAYDTNCHWLGELNAELLFPGIYSRATGERMTLFKGLKVKDLVDALIYIGPSDQWVFAPPRREAYDDEYWAELNRRSMILFGQSLEDRVGTREQATEGAPGCGLRPPAGPCKPSRAPTGGCGSSLPRPDQGQKAASSRCCGRAAPSVTGTEDR